MASLNHSPFQCNTTVTHLLNQISSSSLVNVTRGDLQNLMQFCVMGYESQANEKYSKPLVWIGVYIAIASLFCTVAMGANIFDRLFVKDIVPGKYFPLNAASITVISIAMKLSLDMTGSMPGVLDQVAKLGGLAFMCTMMANLIPSLGSMDNKTLVENIIGLAILVITIIGNISVEIYTGVIGDHMGSSFGTYLVTLTFWYVAMMLLLLLVSISTAIIIPLTKEILEFKYDVLTKALNGQCGLRQRGMLFHEVDERNDQRGRRQRPMFFSERELKDYVTKYWIMAKSGSPQFIIAGTSLAYTSTLICVINAGLFCELIFSTLNGNIRSDYGLAIRIILVIQFVGTIIGTLALVSRCITSLCFRVDRIQPEGHSGRKLTEWKISRIAFLSSRIASLYYGLHIAVFALCSITGFLFEFFHVILRKFTTTIGEGIEVGDEFGKHVLYIEDYMSCAKKALDGLRNPMDRLIQKAVKQQNDNIDALLKFSRGFEGVVDIYSNQARQISYLELDSWSLPVVTLACIAIGVPEISEAKIDKLIDAVDEALRYTHDVEERFNSANENKNIRNTITRVWHEFKENRKWLGHSMQRDQHGEKPIKILEWFTDKAEFIVTQRSNEEHFQYFPDYTVIGAHSMHCISWTIKSKYHNKTELNTTNKQFFNLIQRMIADILCACLTNIPQVIIMKCHSDAIEKREASVEAAVKLLGRSTNILKSLGDAPEYFRNVGPEKMASIDEWRLHHQSWYRPPV